MIPSVNIGAAELDVLKSFAYANIFEQAEHAGHLDRETDASDFAVVLGQDLDLPLKEQGDGALPGHDVDWFIAGVENEGVLHGSFPAFSY